MITNVWWDAPWMSRQYLGAALSEHADMLFVEAPVSVASPLRDRRRLDQLKRRFRRPSEHVALLAPLAIPPQEKPAVRPANARLLARQIRGAIARAGWTGPDIVICNLARSWRLRSAFADSRFVAYLTDTPATSASTGVAVRGVQHKDDAAERPHLLEAADAALACSPPQVEEARRAGVPATYLPHGVDFDTIRAAAETGIPADLARIPSPRIGMIGKLTYRIDFELVRRVATARPEWNFVFVGDKRAEWLTGTELPIEDLPNVHLLGVRPQKELGAYIRGFDVAWVPYTWVEFNRASFPLKVMEYLAAGRPVVANAFDSMRELGAPIDLVAEGDDFLTHLEAALEAADDAARARERVEFARRNSWAARAEAAMEFIAQIEPSVTP